MITHLSNKFATLYEPSKEVAVDEAMIKFQGRSSLKQYMPKKPTKRGIKVWVLGDSTNGYFSRFDVYTGKGEGRVEGLGAHVVKKLTEDLKNKNHHVFFDNYFTSYQLLEDLEKEGIYGCGTASKDWRNFPAALKNPGLKERLVCECIGEKGGIVKLTGIITLYIIAQIIMIIPDTIIITLTLQLHSTEVNQRHSREGRSLRVCGWTTSLSL